jgi:hypothetical protein
MVSLCIKLEEVVQYDTFDTIRIECIDASQTPNPDPYSLGSVPLGLYFTHGSYPYVACLLFQGLLGFF